MKTELRQWLDEHPALNIIMIEKQAGLWRGLLSHYMAGRRKLSHAQENKVKKVLEKYGHK